MRSIKDNPIHEDFRAAELLLRHMYEYRRPPGVVLSGPPGLGKTFLVRKVHREFFSRQIAEFSGSARGLLQFLNDHRDALGLIDDFDLAFYNPAILGILKKVLDTNPPRILSHQVYGESALEPFEITGAWAICCNLDFDRPSLWSPRTYKLFIEPFKSRLSGSIIKISFNEEHILDYTLWIAPTILQGIAQFENTTGYTRRLSEAHQKEILDHFRANADSYPEITPRVIKNLGELRVGPGRNDRDWDLLRRKMLRDFAREKEMREKEIEKMKREGDRAAAEEFDLAPVKPAAAPAPKKTETKSPLLKRIPITSLTHLKKEGE